MAVVNGAKRGLWVIEAQLGVVAIIIPYNDFALWDAKTYDTKVPNEPDAVREWIRAAESELAELTEQAAHAQVKLAEGRRRLVLLYEILASVTNSPADPRGTDLQQDKSVREQVQANARTILNESGNPMRVVDLHAAFIRRAFPLPGRGRPSNIAAHLTTEGGFQRCGRGIYGLDKSSSEEKSVETQGEE